MKVNYVDILYWTAKMLKTNFPNNNIYIDKNEHEIIVPSFFLQVNPLSIVEGFDLFKYKKVNLIIEYVDRTALSEKKLQVIDDLQELIGRGITVAQANGNKRTLPVFNKKPTIADAGILLVTLQYYDGHAEPLSPEDPDKSYDGLMEILSLNVKANDN
jgi:hypothetical protein